MTVFVLNPARSRNKLIVRHFSTVLGRSCPPPTATTETRVTRYSLSCHDNLSYPSKRQQLFTVRHDGRFMTFVVHYEYRTVRVQEWNLHTKAAGEVACGLRHSRRSLKRVCHSAALRRLLHNTRWMSTNADQSICSTDNREIKHTNQTPMLCCHLT